MHPVLRFQIAIGIVAPLYLHRDTLDSRLITVEQVGDRHLITMCLCPAHIHTHQHRGPVLCLRTAGTRVDLQHRLHRVLLLAEHILQFQVLDGLYRLGVGVVHLFLSHHLILVEVEGQLQFVGQGTHLLIAVEPFLDTLHLLHLLLGALSVFPEVRRLRTKILLLVLHLFLIYFQIPMQRIGPL